MKITRILAPVDFSQASHTGLEAAVGLARRFDAGITALLVEDAAKPLPSSDIMPNVEEELTKFVEKAIGKDSGVTIDAVGHPVASEGIVAYAGEGGFDLICMATAGVRGWRRLVLGSVAAEVMRYTHVPVLLVGRLDKIPVFNPPCRALVALDLGPRDDQLIAWGAELAGDGGEMTAMHVVETPVHDVEYGVSLAPVDDQLDAAKHYAERRLGDMLAGIHGLARRTVTVVDGAPAVEIAKAAEAETPHVIVIGTHGRTGIERILVGSVAYRVVRQAQSPVLVFPTVD